MRITFFCPDTHLRYRGDTPEKTGVGGGVTARIYLARALARLGHDVKAIVNTDRPHRMEGAQFLPLEDDEPIRSDVVVVNTTGGDLDAGAIGDRSVDTDRIEVWAGGRTRVKRLETVAANGLVVPSNDLRRFVLAEWPSIPGEVAVIYNGINRSIHPRAGRRNPYRLVYTSHPYKGLETALAVLDRLRAVEPSYTLHVYGGAGLWGEPERDVSDRGRGVVYHGLTNQVELARALEEAGFSFHLQDVPEAFGISMVEAQIHGVLVLASPVGALGELIEDHRTGFLFEGDHRSDQVRERVASCVNALNLASEFAGLVRRSAAALPWDWDLAALAWTGWWDWTLRGKGVRSQATCPECEEQWLLLADGRHCPACGRFDWR